MSVTQRLSMAAAVFLASFLGVAARALSAPATVEIAVVGTTADLQRVRTLFGQGGLAGATPRWVRIARFDPIDVLREHRPPEGRTVRCWVDMSSPGRTRLFFAAGSGERFLVRDLAVSPRFDEMDQQALAEVIERSVTALLDDEQAGLDRAQTQALLESRQSREPPPAPVPEVRATPVPTPVPRTFRVHVAAFYAGQALRLDRAGGDDTVALVHGPGLSLAVGPGGGRRRLAIWASAQVQFPERVVGNDAGVELQATATRAGLELQQAIGGEATDRRRRISAVRLRVGTGLDLVHLTPQPGATDPSAMLTPARWSTSLVVTASVGADLRLGPRFRLGATVFMDVLPTGVHYDLATADGQVTPVFSAARVRPGLALELAAGVL